MDLNNIFSTMAGYQIIDLKSENIKSLSYCSSSKGNQKKYYDCNTKEYIKVNLSTKVSIGKIIW